MSENKGSLASSGEKIVQIIESCAPIGSLGGFVIDDLTKEDEDEFFGILEDL